MLKYCLGFLLHALTLPKALGKYNALTHIYQRPRLKLLISTPVQLLKDLNYFLRCVTLSFGTFDAMGGGGGSDDSAHDALDEGRCQQSAIIIKIMMIILRIIIAEQEYRC